MSTQKTKTIRLTKKQLREIIEASGMPGRVDRRVILDAVETFVGGRIISDGSPYEAELEDMLLHMTDDITDVIMGYLPDIRELRGEWE